MYRAIQQADGTYVIPDVEIFLPYADEKIDPPVMTADELNLFVMNHEDQKADAAKKFGANKTYLPRVHVAHHEEGGVTNNIGAGFVDNLRVQNGILFADLVKVPAEIVDAIEQGKYPYRSVEFVGDKPDVRIIGLALLESREPYHKLPIMDGITRESTSTFTAKNPVRMFQNLRNLVDVKKYQKEKKAMDIASFAKKYSISDEDLQQLQKFMDGGDPEQMQDEDAEQMQEDEVQEMEDDDPEMMDDDDDDVEMFNNFYKGLDMAHDNTKMKYIPNGAGWSGVAYKKDPTIQDYDQWTTSGLGSENRSKIASLAEENSYIDKKHGGDPKLKRLAKLARKNPEKYLLKYREATGTYQARNDARMFQHQVINTLKALQAEVFQMRQEKVNSMVDSELREICEEKGLDYASESRMVRKFQSATDKKDYIKHLKARPSVQVFSAHAEGNTGAPSTPAFRLETQVPQQFQNESKHIQKLAVKLSNAYEHTVATGTKKQVRMFQRSWPQKGEYVKYHVEKEKKQPGYCEKERVFA